MIEVRPLTQHAEFAEAVRLQRVVWGFDEIELLPVRLFVTAVKVGGQSLGAFDGSRMTGFSLAIPGIKANGKGYLHSHMVGVLPEYRNSGVGRAIKLAQRDDALNRGFDLIEWTFDPLEIKNAYFNLERLGAVVRRFVLNQYGTTTSRLHGGLPTDRCIAEWWIASERVASILAGQAPDPPPVETRIEVPTAIEQLRKTDPAEARLIQEGISTRFLDALARGLAAFALERSPEAGTYLLGNLS